MREQAVSREIVAFSIGALSMAVGSLLPWFLYPLYVRYGWTKDFVEHIWPQTMVGEVPLIVLIWILSVPVGVFLVILAGLIYSRAGAKGA